MRVAVVGAGMTGLSLSLALDARGIDHVVLEAAEEPGGVVRSIERGGTVLDLGPQRGRLDGALADLVEELGLGAEVVRADPNLPILIYRDGRLREVPRSLATFARTDLLSWRGKLRALAEPLVRPGGGDETAGELLRRRFGDEAYEAALGPLLGATYGSDPDAMPVRHALPRALDLEDRAGGLLRPILGWMLGGDRAPAFTFRRGMQALPRAIHARVRDRVRTGTSVVEVARQDGAWRLRTDGGDVAADVVVLTVPAPSAARLLTGAAPEVASSLAALRYHPLALVHLRAAVPREGLGFQVARGEDPRILGATWNGRAFGRDEVVTCFLGGGRDPEVVELADDELGAIAREDVQEVTGAVGEVLHVHRVRPGFPSFDATWAHLEHLRTPPGLVLAGAYRSRPGIPGRVSEARRIAERIAGAPVPPGSSSRGA